jgi:hypothetical protein
MTVSLKKFTYVGPFGPVESLLEYLPMLELKYFEI